MGLGVTQPCGSCFSLSFSLSYVYVDFIMNLKKGKKILFKKRKKEKYCILFLGETGKK